MTTASNKSIPLFFYFKEVYNSLSINAVFVAANVLVVGTMASMVSLLQENKPTSIIGIILTDSIYLIVTRMLSFKKKTSVF